MRKSTLASILLSTAFYTPAFSQNIDLTFNAGFFNMGDINGIVVQSGKIYVGGNFDYFEGSDVGHLVRLTTDGTVDNTFNIGSGPNAAVHSLVSLPDEKMLVAGEFTTFDGLPRKNIVRLNSDGSVDESFSFTENVGAGVYAMALQSDGKIIIYGRNFFASQYHLLRLNADGSLDSAFDGYNSSSSIYINKIIVQPDGKILIGGLINNYKGNTGYTNLVRLKADGALDGTFKPGLSAAVHDVKMLSDERMLVATYNTLIRLNANGTIDNSFITPSLTSAISVIVRPDNSIIVGGVYKLNSDGSLADNSLIQSDNVYPKAYRQSDDKILVVVQQKAEKKSLIRLNEDLTVDATFQNSFALKHYRQNNAALVRKENSGFLAATFAQFYCSDGIETAIPASKLMRLTDDFSLLEHVDLPADIQEIGSILLIDEEGKIFLNAFTSEHLAGGGIQNSWSIVKVNSDGSFDPDFTTVFNKNISKLVKQSDGKLIILDGLAVVRLNADGSIDPSFSVDATLELKDLGIQSDGKIVVCARGVSQTFTVNGTPAKSIFRLNNDGSLDTGFKPPILQSSSIENFEIMSDNTILAAGIINASSQVEVAQFGLTGSIVIPPANFSTGIGVNLIKVSDYIFVITYDLLEHTMSVEGLNSDLTINNRIKKNKYYKNTAPGSGVNVSAYPDRLDTLNDGSILILSANNPLYKLKFPSTAPSAPTNLSIDTDQFPKITLTWTDNSGNETAFEIQRSSSGAFSTIADIAEDVTTFKDSLLSYNTLYTYRVRTINLAGESSYSNEVTTLVTGLEDSEKELLSVSPNPTNRYLKINLNSQIEHISILDPMGRVLHYELPNSPDAELNLEHYPAGFYFIKVKGQEKVFVKKIIKQ